MSVLAFKALDYGADKIPDKFFEKLPGGLFTPAERKNLEKNRKKRQTEREPRSKSEQRRSERDRRRAERERTPPTDYDDYSDYDDTDHERDARRKDRRRRAKSLGRSISRSLSRARHYNRSRDLDGEYEMDRAERAEREPYFPPPPHSEYRPSYPQEYSPPPSATSPSVAAGYHDSHDRRASSARPDYGYPPQPASSSAARYTPAAGYAPSPVNASIPPPSQGYTPYNPADYAPPSQGSRAPGNSYASPPPFYRQGSHSQPSLPQYQYPDSHNQLAPYDSRPGRRGSTASSHRRRHGDGKHHRARSAGHHGHSQDSVTDKVRDRFENLDLDDKNLAASVGGALAGGYAGNRMGNGTLSTLIGAGIGALGGREMEKRLEKKKTAREGSRTPQERSGGRRRHSQGPSRDRRRESRYDDYDTYSDFDSDDHRPAARRRGGSKRSPDHYD